MNAGGSSHSQAYQGLAFYPSTITVDAGDTVAWTYPSAEPHTVTFLGAGQATPPPPSDPSAPKPAGGSTYDGSTYTSSGFIAMGYSYSLKFTKPGTYTYYCIIHQPEMVGRVVVNPAGTAYPADEDSYSTQAMAQTAADLQLAAQAVTQFPYPPGGTHIAAGIAPGLAAAAPSHAIVNRFIVDTNVDGSAVTVPAGGTVTWTNQSNNAPHTVTFPVAGRPLPVLPGDPFTPPMGGSTYDGTQVTNSGVLGPGQSYSLTFTKAGTIVVR
ncbi:MAG TPA: plastocyanin/azurin family copper-binding protein [Candidatus Baltobacteraceae bacterium]|nr:plastocyanin/azurin family copper-binding protein [Candidatus Baltobacteraceae bacterium]